MTCAEKLKKINSRRTESANAERICSELCYLDGLSDLRGGKFDSRIEEAADALLSLIEKDGVITAVAVKKIEEMLSDLSPEAKSLKEIFVAHAHIDMNWMWGYNETAVITIDTFRTVLKLMEEYPDFKFSQSQASTYEIVEKYCPEMLDEIRKRVAENEGRWEVAAAEWVETDKNMPNGESLTRQILEAKKYLTKLLNLKEDSITVDFLPDTFGHAVTVPEILADSGIKYMYHCRGGKGPCLYYYKAPSGKKVLAYKDYKWYNGQVTTNYFEIVPGFCKQEKMDTFMCIYGVGDHGGGPSRRDIERIIKYSSWPLTPDIRFGTYGEFFEIAENSGIDFPVIDTERNFIFAGCYTTQSRIKMANRISEARAYEAEALSVMASSMCKTPYNPDFFEKPWRNIVFNQFHDIIPGSGTIETREHALGKFQDTMAALQTSSSASMKKISDLIDTSFIDYPCESEDYEGGGVGFGTNEAGAFRMPSAERGRGSTRIFHVFNTSYYERDEVTELVVWDYAYDNSQVTFTDADGNKLEFCLLSSGSGYWDHRYNKYAVKVKVKPFGYTTVILKQKPFEGRMTAKPFICEQLDHDTINDEPIVLENDKICAVFSKETACLIKLTDKITGEDLIDKQSCYFKYIEEKAESWLVAWRIGQYMKTVNINEVATVSIESVNKNNLFSSFTYQMEYETSVIKVTVTLNKGSQKLDFALNIDWKTSPIKGKIVPQIAFCVPVSYQTNKKSVSEIPYGTILRDFAAYDVPSHGSIGLCRENGNIVALLADTKYGFRSCDDMAQVALIRSSYFPDAYSDQGIHNIKLAVAVCSQNDIDKQSVELCRPLSYVSATCHEGSLPACGQLIKISDGVRVSAIKPSEDKEGFIVRIYDVTGESKTISLEAFGEIKAAFITDMNEKVISSVSVADNKIEVPLDANAVQTVKVIPL